MFDLRDQKVFLQYVNDNDIYMIYFGFNPIFGFYCLYILITQCFDKISLLFHGFNGDTLI